MEGIPLYKQINRIVEGERPNIQKELEISALLIRGWDSNPKSRPEISEFIEFSRKERPAQENLRKVVSQQNVNQNENKDEKLSGRQQNTSILILGGWPSANKIYLLDSKAQSWKELRITLPVGMRDFGAVEVNKEIYVFGGIFMTDCYQGCYKLKNDGSWIKLASLNQKRSDISSSSLVYKGDIWAIGGASKYPEEALKSVEKYDIFQDKWTYIPEMNYAKRYAAAAVYKDRIFVTGGYNGKKFKSVEMFDPKLQKWILFCDLPFGISGHTMLINNSTLSIFGGQSKSCRLNSVWEMDIEDPEKKWTEKQSCKQPRLFFGIGKLSNGIIVFGGYREETSEIFDGNGWIDGPKVPHYISNFAYTSIPRSLEERFLKKFAFEGFLAQNAIRIENKVEKQSGGQQNTSVLILGNRGISNTIYLFDSKAHNWKKLKITLPMGMQDFGAVVLNEKIYIFGGYGCGHLLQGCYKLKDDGSWIKLATLNQGRVYISSSSLVYKGEIWAIGGYSGEYLKSVEKYDISQDKWTYMPEMNYARSRAAAAVFKDRIFVTGGWNGELLKSVKECLIKLKSVEMFDPKLQKWILFCDLPFGISGHTMLISNSILSIFGGSSGSDILNSVWEMDVEDPEKKWTEKQSFNHPRACFGIGKLSNGIIVFGNYYNGETSEIFDGNEWIEGPMLPQELSLFAYTSIPRSLEESFLKKFAFEGFLAQNAAQTENIAEKQSGGQQNTSVLILGGSGLLNTIYLFDSKAQSWKKLSITLPMGMRDFGAVVLNEKIYIFGGYGCGHLVQGCYKLKDDGSWIKLASLNQKRAYISNSCLVYKGDIWVIGGSSGEPLNSVERYDIPQDKWIYIPEMNYARSDAAVAVFKDRIFVTGGWNRKKLKSVEMFDSLLQKWLLFCDLPFELFGHTMLISNSILSIFGGYSESDLNSVWEMDIEDPAKKWTEKQSFKQPRHTFGIGKFPNAIIIFGDWLYNGEISEIFDGNEWIEGPRLPQNLSHFAYTSIPLSLEEKLLRQVVSQQNLPIQNEEEFNSPVLRKRRKVLAQNVNQNENKDEKLSGGQQNTSILILGGWVALNSIYLLDSKAQSWKKLRITLPLRMRDFGAVVLNEEIYIFGEFSKDGSREDCYKLKDNGNWIKLASMNQKRSGIASSSLVYEGDIWAIGGLSNGSSLKSVETYNISQDKWTYMPEMNFPRSFTAAAVFKDRIFVTGGWNGKDLNSMEMFDPKLQKWILFCDLPFGLCGHTMLISNSTLSIFGGYLEYTKLNSVWEMDIEDPEKKWTEKQSFKHKRDSFGIGKLSNEIIVFGGWGRSGETSEIFDGNKWVFGPKLPLLLSSFAYTLIPRSLEESFLKKFS